jgi:photosystem II stability/assembly factor-like uncharacterized protein
VRTRISLAAIAVLAVCAVVAQNAPGERWQQLYFYDELRMSLVINDFKMLTAKRGVAAGFFVDQKGKIKPTTLVTEDGGAHWSPTPVKEVGISLFFVNENTGWLVTGKEIDQTTDGGRTWRKINPLDDVERLYFASDQHGWAVGLHKKVYETSDGGKEWREVPAAATPQSSPENTVYNWIDFAGANLGIITGANLAPSRSLDGLPEWMNPERPRFQREAPRVSILLQTRDGGKNWDATTGSIFGHISRVRLSLAGFGLGLIEFNEGFDFPSEVFRIDWTTGKSERVFRDKNRLITDLAVPPTGPTYLAGIEKLDRLTDSPIPGKVKILRSDDLTNWQEMTVDYRATAHRVMISAVDDRNIWAATDTGMILKLTLSSR